MDPSDQSKTIGENLAALYSRRLITHFTDEEAADYARYAAGPMRRLGRVLPNGRLVWDRAQHRKLVLLSSWTQYAHIESSIMAANIVEWKKDEHLIHTWLTMIKKRKDARAVGGSANLPDVPDRTDFVLLISHVCKGSPKLRQLLRILAEVVVLMGRKVVIWCDLPANQLLVHGLCQLLHIHDAVYSADLSIDSRNEVVKAFTTKADGPKVFIATYRIASIGLNLQAMCNISIEFDSPPNWSTGAQAHGRLRRVGQPHTVEKMAIETHDTFQTIVIRNVFRKALPTAMADLDMTVTSDDHDEDNVIMDAGKFVWHNGELLSYDDPLAAEAAVSSILTPSALVEKILETLSGKLIDTRDFGGSGAAFVETAGN